MSANTKRRILGLILARGGSKRLPGKNIRMLAGKPLLAWSVEASLACKRVAMTLVSTDSQEIADVARQFGASVPFLRPAPLAGDRSTSADAALHALDWLGEQGEAFDAVILLEPTSPLRASGDLDAILATLENRWKDTDAVVSVGQVHLEQPDVMKAIDDEGYLQPWLPVSVAGGNERPVALFPYGVAYAVKVSALREKRSFYPARVLGYPIKRWQNYEIDDELDFLCIGAVMKHFKGQLP